MKISCVILAAGNSARMGESKPFLKFNGEMSFLERIVTVYHSAGIHDIVAVVNEEVRKGLMTHSSLILNDCRFVLNQNPDWGRFYSIKLGLKEAGERPLIFLQNIDNPFVDERILRLLLSGISSNDFAIPLCKGHSGHPVLIANRLIKPITQATENDLNFRELLSSFNKAEIEVNDPGILVNINTQEDFKRCFG
jgi:molybdenum cofactor cytidylyltransferase